MEFQDPEGVYIWESSIFGAKISSTQECFLPFPPVFTTYDILCCFFEHVFTTLFYALYFGSIKLGRLFMVFGGQRAASFNTK